jgi:hypothetical protein
MMTVDNDLDRLAPCPAGTERQDFGKTTATNLRDNPLDVDLAARPPERGNATQPCENGGARCQRRECAADRLGLLVDLNFIRRLVFGTDL